MSEAAAIEKLETLITESQAPEAEAAPSLFQLDKKEIIGEIEVIYDEETRVNLYHKLKWPTLDALIARQRQTPQKTQVLGANRTRARIDDGVEADADLWNKFAIEAKGYEWNGSDPEEWIPITRDKDGNVVDLGAEIPSEHKSQVVRGLFESKFEIERPKSRGFVLGAANYRVKQTYGIYTIYHVFGKISDKNRREISRKSQDREYDLGQAKQQVIFTNLQPYVQIYDKIFDHLEGVTGDDPNIAQRKDLVSPMWKLMAIDELMASFEASRRDSSKN